MTSSLQGISSMATRQVLAELAAAWQARGGEPVAIESVGGVDAARRVQAGTEPLDAAGVREFASGRLAHYKIPRYVMVVEEFPMTVTGKVRKDEMREVSTRELGLA